MTTAVADGDELAVSALLLSCRGCSALPCCLDDNVALPLEGAVACKTAIDRKPDFFSLKFSSGVVFDTLHILKMPVWTSVKKTPILNVIK